MLLIEKQPSKSGMDCLKEIQNVQTDIIFRKIRKRKCKSNGNEVRFLFFVSLKDNCGHKSD